MNYLYALQEWLIKYVIGDVYLLYLPNSITAPRDLLLLVPESAAIDATEFAAGTGTARVTVAILAEDDAKAIDLGNRLYRALRDEVAPFEFRKCRLLTRRMDTLPTPGDNEMDWPQLDTTLSVKFVDIG